MKEYSVLEKPMITRAESTEALSRRNVRDSGSVHVREFDPPGHDVQPVQGAVIDAGDQERFLRVGLDQVGDMGDLLGTEVEIRHASGITSDGDGEGKRPAEESEFIEGERVRERRLHSKSPGRGEDGPPPAREVEG